MVRGICAAAVATAIGVLAGSASATVYSSMATLDLQAHYRADGTTFAETLPVPAAISGLDADGRSYELVASLHLSDFSVDLPPSDQLMTWTISASIGGTISGTPIGGSPVVFDIPPLSGDLFTFDATLDDIVSEVSGLIGLIAGIVPPPGYYDGIGGYVAYTDHDGDAATFDPGIAGGLIEADDLFVFLNEFLGLGIENPLPYVSSADLSLSIELWAHADDGIEVPEPAAIGLIGMGLAGIGFARRRKT